MEQEIKELLLVQHEVAEKSVNMYKDLEKKYWELARAYEWEKEQNQRLAMQIAEKNRLIVALENGC